MEYNFNPKDRSNLKLADPKSAEEFQKFQQEQRRLRAEREARISPAPAPDPALTK